MTLALRYAARSDPGLLRQSNQDSVYAGPHLLAVADGIGGSAAGDVASSIVITAMATIDRDMPPDAVLDALRSGVASADQGLRDAMSADHTLDGMGTTLTSLLFAGDTVGFAHIGDSRAYLLRDGDFVQVTRDDSFVQLLVDEGRISPDEASSHPYRSVVTKAMQGSAPDPEYALLRVTAGDRFLICSDGLSGVVQAETLADVLRSDPDPRYCVDRLVDLALRAGGPDNITVVVADVVPGPGPTDIPVLSIAANVPGATPAAASVVSLDDTVTFDRAALLDAVRSGIPPGQAQPDGPDAGHIVTPATWQAGAGRGRGGAGAISHRGRRAASGPGKRTPVRLVFAILIALAVLTGVSWYLWRWLGPT